MADFNLLFSRKHPLLRRNQTIWERADLAYSGGHTYIEKALIRHVSEVGLEFAERQQRAYYFNYPRKTARIITQFILAETPQRTGADPDMVEDFNRSGLRVDEVMRQLSTIINCFGLGWLIIDMPGYTGEMDMERKQKERIRPYVQALKPWQVPDWAYGNDGKLLWAIVEEHSCDNTDPFKEPIKIVRRRLWTRSDWKLYEVKDNTGPTLITEGKHTLGCVPLIRGEEADGFGMQANHWFEDVVRISDAILNAESEAQMNIIKQMFGLLVVSDSFRNSDFSAEGKDRQEGEKFSHMLARTAALWETDTEKGITRYIAPGGVETATIRAEIQNLKKEMFDVVGLAVQKESKESQTAESKAWDHQNVSQFLASRADMLEQAELKAWEMCNAWDKTIPIPSVSYNREFSVVDMANAVEALLNLSSISPGTEYNKEIYRSGVKMMEKIKKIAPEDRKAIDAEIKAYVKQEIPVPEMNTNGFGSNNTDNPVDALANNKV